MWDPRVRIIFNLYPLQREKDKERREGQEEQSAIHRDVTVTAEERWGTSANGLYRAR
jgi:hypothetical protein